MPVLVLDCLWVCMHGGDGCVCLVLQTMYLRIAVLQQQQWVGGFV